MSSISDPLVNADPNAGSETVDTELNTSTTQVDGVQEGQEGATGDEVQQPVNKVDGQPDKQQDKAGETEDGRVIPNWMRGLKESNPQAYQKAKTDFFELRDRRAVHPTAQAAREEHQALLSIGGVKGVQAVQTDLSFLKDARKQFANGDPAFTADFWAEDPVAAALHVPPMLEAFRKADLAGYQTFTAKLWDAEFQAVGMGRGLQNLIQAIKTDKKDEALGILDSIAGWYSDIQNAAKRAEDPRVKSLLAREAARREADEKTASEAFIQDYRTTAVNQVADKATKLFDNFFKGKKVDAEDRTDLIREALAVANRMVGEEKDYQKNRDAFLKNQNKEGAIEFTLAAYDKHLLSAIKRVARRYGIISGAPAQGQGPGTKQGNQPGARPEAGWTRVNARPDPMQIDRNRTSDSMILSGKAILKDGKKLDWSHLKKQAS